MKITVGQAINAAILAMTNAQQIMSAVRSAQAQGRDELTDEEVALFRANDDASREELQSEIDRRS